MILYFAYGSNLDWVQMKQRCPSATFVNIALLLNFKLAFTRKSHKRLCGVADIIADESEHVWGVLYQISELDLGNLDSYEGYNPSRTKNVYTRCEIHVYACGDKKKPLTVFTYVIENKSMQHIPPNKEYLDLLLKGAEHWHLPHEYIEKVNAVRTEE